MTYVIKKATGRWTAPGEWNTHRCPDGGEPGVSINCPRCEHLSSLRRPKSLRGVGGAHPDHEVSPDGGVSPSVVCQ